MKQVLQIFMEPFRQKGFFYGIVQVHLYLGRDLTVTQLQGCFVRDKLNPSVG